MTESDPYQLFPDDDERLLVELRSIAQELDPAPSAYLDYAAAALSFARIDAEIGLLVELSAESAAAIRDASGGGREAEFSFSDLLLSMTYTNDSVTGSVLPASDGEVRVLTRSSVDQSLIDPAGTFTATRSERGPFRVVLVIAGRSYSTDWIV